MSNRNRFPHEPSPKEGRFCIFLPLTPMYSSSSILDGYLASLSIGTNVEGDAVDSEMLARMICEEGTEAQRLQVHRILFEKGMDGLIGPMKRAARVADGIKALSAGTDAMLQPVDHEAVARAVLAEAEEFQRARVFAILRAKGKGDMVQALELQAFPAAPAGARPAPHGAFHEGGSGHVSADPVSDADRA